MPTPRRPFRRAAARPAPRTHAAARFSRTRMIDIAAIAVIALVAVVFAATRPGCAGLSDDVASGAAEAYVSPYDWDNLDRSDGRYAYYESGRLASSLGIDVSDHQGAIDWNAVAGDGIEFALVRAGYRGYTDGTLFADTRFAENVDGAAAAGLEVGAYFFSQATSIEEAVEEADFALSQIGGRYLALPVVYDHEPVVAEDGRANDLSPETVSACAEAFCARVEEAGYSTMIYGNASDMARYDSSVTRERPVWFAEYDVPAPTARFDFSIWQYSNGGSVAGIATAVDMNILFETAPQAVR